MHRRVQIASAVGLHARPAALLSQAAAAQPAPVHIAKVTDGVAGDPVDAASVLGLMALGVKHGEEVELSTEGDSAAATLDELASLLSRDLDSEPVNA